MMSSSDKENMVTIYLPSREYSFKNLLNIQSSKRDPNDRYHYLKYYPLKKRICRSLKENFSPMENSCQFSRIKTFGISSESSEELTGDFVRPLCLPTIKGGRHPDLKSISKHTMAALLRGEYDKQIASFKVLDCRYRYEYEGGHIRNAINWFNPNFVQAYVDAQKEPAKLSTAESPRHIHIFHCEFSITRGPRAYRLLREIDRSVNANIFPTLYFPEIYLLEGGYKAFYETYPELCTPRNYVRMRDKKYTKDLKLFKSQSKSWLVKNEKDKLHIVRSCPSRIVLQPCSMKLRRIY